MDDMISRQAVIDICDHAIDLFKGQFGAGVLVAIKESIEELPPAQFATDTNVGTKLGTNLAEVGTDCISRQAAIDAIRDMQAFEDDNGQSYLYIYDLIAVFADEEELPSAQPRGKWIYHIDDLFPAESTKECDQCHAEQPLICDDEFCPHCGAKMEVTDG